MHDCPGCTEKTRVETAVVEHVNGVVRFWHRQCWWARVRQPSDGS